MDFVTNFVIHVPFKPLFNFVKFWPSSWWAYFAPFIFYYVQWLIWSLFTSFQCMHGSKCKIGSYCTVGRRLQEVNILGGLILPVWGTIEKALAKQVHFFAYCLQVVLLQVIMLSYDVIPLHSAGWSDRCLLTYIFILAPLVSEFQLDVQTTYNTALKSKENNMPWGFLSKEPRGNGLQITNVSRKMRHNQKKVRVVVMPWWPLLVIILLSDRCHVA